MSLCEGERNVGGCKDRKYWITEHGNNCVFAPLYPLSRMMVDDSKMRERRVGVCLDISRRGRRVNYRNNDQLIPGNAEETKSS